MRGKLFLALIGALPQRITPADAGKTCATGLRGMPLRDHPRGCGENVKKKLLAPYTAGSPPRMRGKHNIRSHARHRIRITPADAGKTAIRTTCTMSHGDHPRGCGENGAHARRWCCEMGSPPRMRGKQPCTPSGTEWKRITPADAGKTRRSG